MGAHPRDGPVLGRLSIHATDMAGVVAVDEVYADVEREAPELPSDLTDLGQEIILRRYLDATQRGVALAHVRDRRRVRSIPAPLRSAL